MKSERQRPLDVAYDEDFWVDGGSLGSVHDLSGDRPDDAPTILVPDGKGDYREHVAVPAKRRLGF